MRFCRGTTRQRAAALAAILFFSGQVMRASAEPVVETTELTSFPIPQLIEVLSSTDVHKDPAVVQVHVKTGAVFEGVIASSTPEKGTCTVLNQSGQVSIINVHEVSAITILHAGEAKVALQGGRILRESRDVVATHLQLRKDADAMGKKFATSVAVELNDSEKEDLDCRFIAGHLLQALDAALEDVTADDDGRAALKRYSGGIHIRQTGTASLAVDSDGSAVHIGFDCKTPLRQGFEKAVLEGVKKLL